MQETPFKMLLVEDDPDDVWMMRRLLTDRWDGPFELVHTELLSAAIERRENDRFDVILLDLGLPDSRGLETFFAMYTHAAGVPIIVLSSHADESMAIQAVQAGAQDYLVKGDVNDRVLVRSIRYAMERSRRSRLQPSRRGKSRDLPVAQEIRQQLSPSQTPKMLGFEIAGALFPAPTTAGDYYDFIPMIDGCQAIVIGDVGRPGTEPTLLMPEMRICLRTLVQTHNNIGEILTRANQIVTSDAGERPSAAVAMARLDPRSRSLAYAGAGQRGYLLHPGIDVTILESSTIPLGAKNDTIVPEISVSLHTGDLFAFFTDGLAEAEADAGERFGMVRPLEIIRSGRDQSAAAIIEAVHNEVLTFCGKQPPQDDIAMVVVKALEPA